MQNRIGTAAPSRTTIPTTQADEALRRARLADAAQAGRNADRLQAATTARAFLTALDRLATQLPHAPGPAIRLTTTLIDDGQPIGHPVDIDTVNLGDLAAIAARRANTLPALLSPPVTRPTLHVVGGGQ